MKKVTTLVLMLCLVFSGALCYAHSVTRIKNVKGDGAPVIIITKAHHGGNDKSGSIVPSIYDHVLSVMFSENLGQVAVEVSTASGAQIDCLSVLTPNGLQIYIPNAGNYTVTFTLSDGDEYYGEFTITD
jgi:hypothetical protein